MHRVPFAPEVQQLSSVTCEYISAAYHFFRCSRMQREQVLGDKQFLETQHSYFSPSQFLKGHVPRAGCALLFQTRRSPDLSNGRKKTKCFSTWMNCAVLLQYTYC